ncbi:uncharacterized protein PFL1_05600 [Pseudozyma flocculosa PF-1]|uniref:Mog1p/PsbP-like protein n=2 Tax=Pseudozyma flocculosa TaxID=84751 RepID=A0A5C3F9J5_9BASI|nr:uncharacterized protein PFL1_05600 [Pseudozyma flocculosa PF-1]EPQ26965.1 hypothetical protein PFL1_05600 [Pseudozyma flocculosa PF-1]SPO41123.1 uncharacterized protein PSFLO_06605 [Pseudozyma flocculosa]
MSETRDLFGGAITAQFPTGFLDASQLRQVPDNQEVLIRNDSDVSCIIEVLQLATEEGAGQDLDKAIRFHFGSLAHDNSASSSNIESVRHLEPAPSTVQHEEPAPTPRPSLLVGTQVIKKFGKATEPDDLVRIRLALWRLEGKSVDLVMSLNEPLPRGTAAEAAPSADLDAAFEQAAASLKIRDWSLFA